MAQNAQLSRHQLIESLRGCELQIPDLQALFGHWPQQINPELDSLRTHVDEWLRMWVLDY